MKPHLCGKGYLGVALFKGKKQGKTHYIHRLVAVAFIPNSENLPQVNHKDENKQNNVVSNLEWCDALYNINYGNAKAKISESHIRLQKGKPVMQIDRQTLSIIAKYPNSAVAMNKTGIDASAINKCCLHRPKFRTAGGFIWKYAE